MAAVDEMLRIVCQELQAQVGLLGVSVDYPHRPIPPSIAESALIASISGARVAPILTWFLGFLERDGTSVGPHRPGDLPLQFTAALTSRNSDTWFRARTPAETDTQDAVSWSTSMIGNATDLSAFLVTSVEDATKAPNLNLDCDRGYAYKTWHHHGNPSTNPFATSAVTPVNLDYI